MVFNNSQTNVYFYFSQQKLKHNLVSTVSMKRSSSWGCVYSILCHVRLVSEPHL